MTCSGVRSVGSPEARGAKDAEGAAVAEASAETSGPGAEGAGGTGGVAFLVCWPRSRKAPPRARTSAAPRARRGQCLPRGRWAEGTSKTRGGAGELSRGAIAGVTISREELGLLSCAAGIEPIESREGPIRVGSSSSSPAPARACAAVGTVVESSSPRPLSQWLSSSKNSRTPGKRSSGSLARARSRIRWSAPSTPLISPWRGLGVSLQMASSSAGTVLPWKGRWPLIISYSITPRAQTSPRTSPRLSPSMASGGRYEGVPTTPPALVSRSSAPVRVTKETPKSSTLGRSTPFSSRTRNTFSGLRSRWMTPLAWATVTPFITRSRILTASSGASDPWRLRRCSSVSPCSSSMTMNGAPQPVTP